MLCNSGDGGLLSHRAESRFSAVSFASVIAALTFTHTPNGIRTRNFSGVILYVCQQTALLAGFIFHLFVYFQCLSWTATHRNGAADNYHTKLKLRERYRLLFRLLVCSNSNTSVYLFIYLFILFSYETVSFRTASLLRVVS